MAEDSRGAVWAPSGRWIAYDVEFAGRKRNGIYVVRPDGMGRRRLTRGNDTDPLWSPDGSKIAFTHSSASPLVLGDLYVMTDCGADPHRVAKDVADYDWSPDGTKLAFDSLRSNGIWVVGVSDPRTVAVTRNPAAYGPTWSPTGNRIAFYVADLPGHGVAVASLASKKVRLIAGAETDGFDWLQDGKRLLVSRDKEIDFVRLSDRASRRLVRPGHYPDVSPDGKRVAFERLAPPRYAYGPFTSAIFIIDVSGHGLRQVTQKRSRP